MKQCRFEGCTLKSHAKNLCAGHYEQHKKGKTLKKLYNHMSLLERIEEHIRYVENGCMIWDHRLDSRGYPQMKYRGGQFLVHREYYKLKVRDLQRHETLDHLCRIRTCINPEHLEPVHARENTKRMHAAQYYEKELKRLREFIYNIGYNPETLLKIEGD